MPADSLRMNFSLRPALARLRQSAFFRNMLIVMSGTAFAQALGFVLSPVISRLYSPADFGVFGSFTAVLGVITAGVTLEYTQAIMLPKEKDDALNLFVLACLVTAAVGLGCLLACLIAPATMLGLMKSANAWLLVLLVLGVWIGGLNQALQAWCVRVKAFKRTSASQVVRSVSANGLQVGLGWGYAGPLSLIVSSVLADAMANLSLWRGAVADLANHRSEIRWQRIRRLAGDYRDFPFYAASQNVINALSLGLPVLLLTYFHGLPVAGAYAFGLRLLGTPMRLVLQALRQVLFQKAGETQHQGRPLYPLYLKVTLGLLVAGLGPALLLAVFAPSLFTWVFGAKWQTAGEYARYLTLWMWIVFANAPAVLFARLVRLQRQVFFLDLLTLSSRFLVLLLGGLYLAPLPTVAWFSVVGAVMNGLLILYVGHTIRRREREGRLVAEDESDLSTPPHAR